MGGAPYYGSARGEKCSALNWAMLANIAMVGRPRRGGAEPGLPSAPRRIGCRELFGLRPGLAGRGVGLLGEVVEFAVEHAEAERLPLGGGEVELGSVRVLRVAHHVETVVLRLVGGPGEQIGRLLEVGVGLVDDRHLDAVRPAVAGLPPPHTAWLGVHARSSSLG